MWNRTCFVVPKKHRVVLVCCRWRHCILRVQLPLVKSCHIHMSLFDLIVDDFLRSCVISFFRGRFHEQWLSDSSSTVSTTPVWCFPFVAFIFRKSRRRLLTFCSRIDQTGCESLSTTKTSWETNVRFGFSVLGCLGTDEFVLVASCLVEICLLWLSLNDLDTTLGDPTTTRRATPKLTSDSVSTASIT